MSNFAYRKRRWLGMQHGTAYIDSRLSDCLFDVGKYGKSRIEVLTCVLTRRRKASTARCREDLATKRRKSLSKLDNHRKDETGDNDHLQQLWPESSKDSPAV